MSLYYKIFIFSCQFLFSAIKIYVYSKKYIYMTLICFYIIFDKCFYFCNFNQRDYYELWIIINLFSFRVYTADLSDEKIHIYCHNTVSKWQLHYITVKYCWQKQQTRTFHQRMAFKKHENPKKAIIHFSIYSAFNLYKSML